MSKGVVLVIGAGDATGGAIAKRFAREGYEAVMTRRTAEKLEPLAEEIRAAGGIAHASTGLPLAWVMGSTFERGVATLPPSLADQHAAHAANLAKLRTLQPQAAMAVGAALQAAADGVPPHAGAARSWSAVRCTSPDRLPIAGPVAAAELPGLWTCTAMGARGLTLALLCGELLAARLHGEPLPLDARLARALGTERL